MLSSTVSGRPVPESRYGHTLPRRRFVHGPAGEPGLRGNVPVILRPFPAAQKESDPERSARQRLPGFIIVGLILDGGEVGEPVPAVILSFGPGALLIDDMETVGVKVTDRHTA